MRDTLSRDAVSGLGALSWASAVPSRWCELRSNQIGTFVRLSSLSLLLSVVVHATGGITFAIDPKCRRRDCAVSSANLVPTNSTGVLGSYELPRRPFEHMCVLDCLSLD